MLSVVVASLMIGQARAAEEKGGNGEQAIKQLEQEWAPVTRVVKQ